MFKRNRGKKLREVERSLEEHRKGSSRRESELQDATSQLVQAADFQNRELQQRQFAEQRFAELHAESQAEHETLLREQEDALRECHILAQRKLQESLSDTRHVDEHRQEAEEWRIEFAEKREDARNTVRERVSGEESRTQEALLEMEGLRSELMRIVGESQAEGSEVKQARHELALEVGHLRAREEQRFSELHSHHEAMHGLSEAHQGLENEVKKLHNELGKVAYTLGQRDRELQTKDLELSEVRRSLVTMQDEMDEVNEELRRQGQRVLRVERCLRHSRDLGDQVRAMRDMLKESHTALAQLCALLERERARREDCAHGLKQQKVRTELLLQLLHNFKSRTNDLAPGTVLGHAAELQVHGGCDETKDAMAILNGLALGCSGWSGDTDDRIQHATTGECGFAFPKYGQHSAPPPLSPRNASPELIHHTPALVAHSNGQCLADAATAAPATKQLLPPGVGTAAAAAFGVTG